MRKRMGRRGQEAIQGFSVTGLILIIFLVLVIAGIWYVVTYVKGVSQNLPGQGEAIIQACNIINPTQLQETYCSLIRPIRTNEYTTCDEADKYGLVINDAVNKKAVCTKLDTDSPKARAIRFRDQCAEKKLDDTKDKVNGVACGEWKIRAGGTPATQTEKGTCQTKGAVTGDTCGQYNDNKAGCEGAIASGQSCLWVPA